MAGKRKGTGKPLKIETSARRLRAKVDAELAATGDPAGRVNAAADYVRAALRRHPARANVADTIVADLLQVGDQILELNGGAS